MKYAGVVGAALVAASLSACAKNADEVNASYVSSDRYANRSCDYLLEEEQRIRTKVAQLADDQDDAATRDAVATGVGLVLFWPALFLLAGGDEENELASMKGEYEAITEQIDRKNC